MTSAPMTSTAPPALVWFRQDLRLDDNPALAAAAAGGAPIVALYLLDEESPGARPPGGAARWWLHHSLASLGERLSARGVQLVLRRGPGERAVCALVEEVGAGAVYWNRGYEPWRQRCDAAIARRLRARGVAVESFNAALLFEPWSVETKSGGPYRVYTPFWRALRGRPVAAPSRAPQRLRGGPDIRSDRLASWRLLPRAPDWAGGLRESWAVGEPAAQARLADFLEEAVSAYARQRDRPDRPATSRLSPHLRWGEIGPRQVWHATLHALDAGGASPESAWRFLGELGWREFSYHLLHHWPSLPTESWRESFRDFPWREDASALAAWQRGRTGYPIVDAGLRALWATGWLHNRLRMIVASFLVKDLLIAWQQGEAWFWDTLVDADPASNAASWQWVAGCGADAAPYFRIFNPVTQGERFDPEGSYLRRWVPELAALPDAVLHKPWTASRETLARAGVTLGETYPQPLVDHAAARRRALAAFATVKQPPRAGSP